MKITKLIQLGVLIGSMGATVGAKSEPVCDHDSTSAYEPSAYSIMLQNTERVVLSENPRPKSSKDKSYVINRDATEDMQFVCKMPLSSQAKAIEWSYMTQRSSVQFAQGSVTKSIKEAEPTPAETEKSDKEQEPKVESGVGVPVKFTSHPDLSRGLLLSGTTDVTGHSPVVKVKSTCPESKQTKEVSWSSRTKTVNKITIKVS